MLLNDEEIDNIGFPVPEACKYKYERCIAKVQLKKVVEWGGELCIEHHGSWSFVRRRQCDKCWETLLGLVEG